jgi:hypothetical protein
LGRIRPELIANFLARCVFDRSLFCYTGWVEMFRPARGHRGGRVITAGRNSGTAGRDSAGSAEAAAGADESLQRADPRADAADGLVIAGRLCPDTKPKWSAKTLPLARPVGVMEPYGLQGEFQSWVAHIP